MGAKSFITANGIPISLGQALRYLQAAGKLDNVITEILRQHILERELQTRIDLAIAPETLNQVITEFRLQNQLVSPEQFQAWLTQQGWDDARFRQQVLVDLQFNQLQVKIAEPKLQEYFIERKLSLDQVVLSRIVVPQKELAAELKAQLDEGARFEELAQNYSQTDDRYFNGMIGLVSRGDLPDVLRAAIDPAAVGGIVGPLEVEEAWMIFRVEKFLPASLDNTQLRQTLQDELFEQWLMEQLQQMTVEVYVEE
jgi:parvulin-like peptidyl-prolyl isomerase